MNSTNFSDIMLLCGARVKECRNEAGLTQADLIEKIENLPENKGKRRNEKHLSAVEQGKRQLSAEYAHLISKILNVRADYLLGKDNLKSFDDYCKSIFNNFFQDIHQKQNTFTHLHNYLQSTGAKISYKFKGVETIFPASHPEINGEITSPVWKLNINDTSKICYLESIYMSFRDLNCHVTLNEYYTFLENISDFIELNILNFLRQNDRNISNSHFITSYIKGYEKDTNYLKDIHPDLSLDHLELMAKYL